MSAKPATHATDVGAHHDELHRVLELEKRLGGRGGLFDFQVTCATREVLSSGYANWTSAPWPVVHAGVEFWGCEAAIAEPFDLLPMSGGIYRNGATLLATWTLPDGDDRTGVTTYTSVRLGPDDWLSFTIDGQGDDVADNLVVTAYLRGPQPSSGGVEFRPGAPE